MHHTAHRLGVATRTVAARERAGETRSEALRGMLGDYITLMHEGEPVHTWDV